MDEEFDLHIERRKTFWVVTSPQIRGLLVSGHTRTEALAAVPGALDELEAALRQYAPHD